MKSPRLNNLRYSNAFTLLELLIVISIIIVLAGLTIGTMGYVMDKGKRSRAEAEIAAISAALESYKADNGVYPQTTATNTLNAQTAANPCTYQTASLDLYKQLTADMNANFQPASGSKSYFSFK